MHESSYALVTPARNEGDYLAATIESVINQTLPPIRWVIVSDSSTDRTEAVAREYESIFPFIKVVRREGGPAAGFASKVFAFNRGAERLKGLDFEFIGNLDADVTFEPDYFARLLDEFKANPRLGVGGGWIHENTNGRFEGRFGNSTADVAGAVQLFRKECFERIGGFPPLPYGGEDAAAQVMARLQGWEVQSFPHLRVDHHKVVPPTFVRGGLMRFREGMRDYSLAYHPVFQLFKCARRVFERPYVVGGLLRFIGYVSSWLRGIERIRDPYFVLGVRREQMRRVWSLLGQGQP